MHRPAEYLIFNDRPALLSAGVVGGALVVEGLLPARLAHHLLHRHPPVPSALPSTAGEHRHSHRSVFFLQYLGPEGYSQRGRLSSLWNGPVMSSFWNGPADKINIPNWDHQQNAKCS